MPDDTSEDSNTSSPLADPNLDDSGLVNNQVTVENENEGSPSQLGLQRYVYAAFFLAGLLGAVAANRVLFAVWNLLARWRPGFGEPAEDYVMAASGLLGLTMAISLWRTRAIRALAEQVVQELSLVTWPTRREVANNTVIVVLTTLVATAFFSVMDQFWSFVTNWVYKT